MKLWALKALAAGFEIIHEACSPVQLAVSPIAPYIAFRLRFSKSVITLLEYKQINYAAFSAI